ncbi:MAG: response regulator [Myxococcales bacterium]|nr:response regulator [Myxococcales bacterium]
MFVFFASGQMDATLGARLADAGASPAELTDDHLADDASFPCLWVIDGQPPDVARADARLRAAGRRFDTTVLAAVTATADIEALFASGADDVLLREQPSDHLAVRLEACRLLATTRFDFIANLAVSAEVTDTDGRIQYANPAFVRQTGLELAALRASVLEELPLDESQILPADNWTRTRLANPRGGRSRDHEVCVSPLRRPGSPGALFLKLRRDVTHQEITAEQLRLLEAELRRTEHMAAVGTLAAGIAHEINNPLTYVMTNVSLVLDAAAQLGEEELTEALRDAMEGGERVRKIIADLRLFSRDSGDQLEIVELEALLDSTVNIAASELRQRARLIRDYGSIPPVRGNRARLGQVFLNLIVNAAQACTNKTGEHEVRLKTGFDEAGWVYVEISDTGEGMRPEVLARIFQPFFTTKPAGLGTGLGLSLSHGIIEGLGGRLSAESERGKGSTFRVDLLPAPRDAALPRAPRLSRAPEPGKRARILIVDDDARVGRALARILKDHDVVTAGSAEPALTALSAGEAFDAVYCDILMPGRSGIELFDDPAVVASSTPRERWIFMSGGIRDPELGRFLQRVDNPFLPKPCGPREVMAALARALGTQSSPPSLSRSTLPAGSGSSNPSR